MPSSRASDTTQSAGPEQQPQHPQPQQPGEPQQSDQPGPPQQPDQPQQPEVERDLRAELAEAEDRYKRALADLDNYRKRAARDVERRVAEVREALVRDWLNAVDSVERAMAMNSVNPLTGGLRAVLDQMETILERQGVRRVGQVGEPFDPERHEAVGVHSTTDVPDRSIADVARSGWAMGDRVIRPAQVVVARAPAPEG